MMRKTAAFLLALLLSAGMSGSALASLSHWDFTFSSAQQSSVAPVSGSFNYDPVSGFSNFMVDWNGVLFDLTDEANAPNVTGTLPPCAATGAGLAFQMLTRDDCLADVSGASFQWLGVTAGSASSPKAKFQFGWTAPGDNVTLNSGFVSDPAPSTRLNGHGDWLAADPPLPSGTGVGAAAVPEPGTLVLLGLGLAGLAATRRRRQ